MDVNGMMERATLLHRSGKLEEARRLYMEVTQGAPDHAEAFHRLGLIAQAAGRLDEAADYMREAIRLDGRQPLYFFGLGQVMQDLHESAEAESMFRQALALNPNLAPAYNHLGLVLQGEQRLDEALHCFREAARCHPGYARAYNNLGNLLKARGELQEAIRCFREAVRLNPDYHLALFNLGMALEGTGDIAGAEEIYSRAAGLDPGDFETLSRLGWTRFTLNNLAGAEQAFRQALALKPDTPPLLNGLGYTLRIQGRMDECLEAYRRASELDTDNLRGLMIECLALPPVYADRDDMQAWRQRYIEGLARLEGKAGRFGELPKNQVLTQLQWVNFLLAYQGQNDCRLQSRYAGFAAKVLSSVAPEFFEPLLPDINAGRRRLKIGFLSCFFRECTVGSYFKSWVTLLDRERFEVFVYYTGPWRDALAQEIEASVEHYAKLVGVEAVEIARRIKSDSLDVLIYPELGMDVTAYMLGAMRLAPVQCAAWGHPVTTGHRNIDYYFSCASMEPDGAGEHYTEQLILLSGIGTYYAKPSCPLDSDRKRFNLPMGRHLYLCPQSMHKIHPDNDELFLDILERDPDAALVFFQDMFVAVTKAFMARLQRGMAARKMPVDKRVIFLPRMNHDAYLQVNLSCDAMLDTLYWSGGNTSLDALACALPVVTLPGEFMRGRQSYAMLKTMGLDELIARDRREYVTIALRLGIDVAWRNEIRQRIAQNTGKVFENDAPLKELEQFLLSRFAG